MTCSATVIDTYLSTILLVDMRSDWNQASSAMFVSLLLRKFFERTSGNLTALPLPANDTKRVLTYCNANEYLSYSANEPQVPV